MLSPLHCPLSLKRWDGGPWEALAVESGGCSPRGPRGGQEWGYPVYDPKFDDPEWLLPPQTSENGSKRRSTKDGFDHIKNRKKVRS